MKYSPAPTAVVGSEVFSPPHWITGRALYKAVRAQQSSREQHYRLKSKRHTVTRLYRELKWHRLLESAFGTTRQGRQRVLQGCSLPIGCRYLPLFFLQLFLLSFPGVINTLCNCWLIWYKAVGGRGTILRAKRRYLFCGCPVSVAFSTSVIF